MPENRIDFCDYWEPPLWLNKIFFCEILKDYTKDSTIEIISMKIKPAISKGEHFASCMYRIEFNYEGTKIGIKKTKFICKTTNMDKFAKDILTEQNAYKNELNMYEKILPEFENILKSVNIFERLWPKAVYVHHKESAIIFEDLKDNGFVMAQRSNGLDKVHAKMVLKTMAKMHSVSVVYNQINNNIMPEKFNKGMYNRMTIGITPVFLTNLEALAKEVSTWNGWEYYGKKLTKMCENMLETGKKTFDVIEDDFNCLLHGDLWVNNIMFKYNENKQPIDIIMLDFQYCVWGSPGIDVLYFLCTSLSDDLRFNNQDEFIQYYHKYLVKNLKILKYTGHIPNLHDIQIQFLKKYFYAFTSTCLVLPMMISDSASGADFQVLFGTDDYSKEFKCKIYQTEKMKKILKRVLPIFDQKGILDL